MVKLTRLKRKASVIILKEVIKPIVLSKSLLQIFKTCIPLSATRSMC